MRSSTANVMGRQTKITKLGKKKINRMKLKETLFGYSLISPMLIGTFVLVLLPIISSFILSMTKWNFITGIEKIQFIGFDNYVQLFHDKVFIKSIINNFLLLITVFVKITVGLFLAVMINNYAYFKNTFKIIYFMPYISSVVAVAIVWQVLFHPSFGPINSILKSIGIQDVPGWLGDPNFALPSVMMIWTWIGIGFNLVVYIAGLQSIPKELYEAAEMDGATSWQRFFNITLPLLSPTTFFLLITNTINTFKAFDIIQVLTKGGPANSTSIIVYDLYDSAFVNLKMGYASSMAMILFIFVFIITILQWYGQKKWVNY